MDRRGFANGQDGLRTRWLQDVTVQAKIDAGQAKALEMGWDFEIWTEAELFESEREMRVFAAALPKE